MTPYHSLPAQPQQMPCNRWHGMRATTSLRPVLLGSVQAFAGVVIGFVADDPQHAPWLARKVGCLGEGAVARSDEDAAKHTTRPIRTARLAGPLCERLADRDTAATARHMWHMCLACWGRVFGMLLQAGSRNETNCQTCMLMYVQTCMRLYACAIHLPQCMLMVGMNGALFCLCMLVVACTAYFVFHPLTFCFCLLLFSNRFWSFLAYFVWEGRNMLAMAMAGSLRAATLCVFCKGLSGLLCPNAPYHDAACKFRPPLPAALMHPYPAAAACGFRPPLPAALTRPCPPPRAHPRVPLWFLRIWERCLMSAQLRLCVICTLT